jgi:hypothetical protein
MIRGCIVIGDLGCDGCNRIMEHGEQYLVVEEDKKKIRLCVDCALKAGKARYAKEKGEKILTFFQ